MKWLPKLLFVGRGILLCRHLANTLLIALLCIQMKLRHRASVVKDQNCWLFTGPVIQLMLVLFGFNPCSLMVLQQVWAMRVRLFTQWTDLTVFIRSLFVFHVDDSVSVICRSGSGVRALENVLPLSSRYLVSSTSGSASLGPVQQKQPDMATLVADNHALHDVVQQQRFKLKVCYMTSYYLI